MSGHLDLHAILDRQAEWRQIKAAQHPDDRRNVDAVALLNKLADQAGRSAFRPDLLDRYSKLAGSTRTSLQASEEESQLLRDVGFHFFPDSVNEFLEELIERIGRRAWKEADPEARRNALQLLRTASLDEKGPVS